LSRPAEMTPHRPVSRRPRCGATYHYIFLIFILIFPL
jgi:hypothetical protein